MSCSISSQAKWRTAFARHDGGSPFGWTAASDEGSGFGGMLHRVNKESRAPTRPGIVAFELRGFTKELPCPGKPKAPEPEWSNSGASAVAFFGASPVVASASDRPRRRDPGGRRQPYNIANRSCVSVTFSFDPTTLFSVTRSNDLTGKP